MLVGIVMLVASGALPAAQEDGGAQVATTERDARAAESPYAKWSLGPPTDPEWFPIGVWLQDPALATRYRELGINTFVGLWKGPTEAQLEQLSKAGMRVVCGLNRVGRLHLDDPTIIAWMQVDEPDNRGDGSGPRATPEEVQKNYELLVKRDPTRPVWMNLGQGVANDSWKGRGARMSDYPEYVKAADILSFDVYPVTNIQKSDGENYLWYVAKGVRRMRNWSHDERVVWNVIECTKVGGPTKKPTPAQMRAEVWMSLIFGSRGIVYFCHEFDPAVKAAALLADREMSAAVARVNAEIRALAPVLNSPTIPDVVEAKSSNAEVPVGTMLKRVAGETYLFTIATRNAATKAEFRVAGGGTKTLTVVGEDREVEMKDGVFSDSFRPYEFHLYRSSDGS